MFQKNSGLSKKLHKSKEPKSITLSCFSCKTFCLTKQKHFVEEPFCVSENVWYRKSLKLRRGGCIKISGRFFCLTVPNIFVEQAFCVSDNFWYPETLGLRKGVSRFSLELFLATKAEQFRNFVEENFSVSETMWSRKKIA